MKDTASRKQKLALLALVVALFLKDIFQDTLKDFFKDFFKDTLAFLPEYQLHLLVALGTIVSGVIGVVVSKFIFGRDGLP